MKSATPKGSGICHVVYSNSILYIYRPVLQARTSLSFPWDLTQDYELHEHSLPTFSFGGSDCVFGVSSSSFCYNLAVVYVYTNICTKICPRHKCTQLLVHLSRELKIEACAVPCHRIYCDAVVIVSRDSEPLACMFFLSNPVISIRYPVKKSFPVVSNAPIHLLWINSQRGSHSRFI